MHYGDPFHQTPIGIFPRLQGFPTLFRIVQSHAKFRYPKRKYFPQSSIRLADCCSEKEMPF